MLGLVNRNTNSGRRDSAARGSSRRKGGRNVAALGRIGEESGKREGEREEGGLERGEKV